MCKEHTHTAILKNCNDVQTMLLSGEFLDSPSDAAATYASLAHLYTGGIRHLFALLTGRRLKLHKDAACVRPHCDLKWLRNIMVRGPNIIRALLLVKCIHKVVKECRRRDGLCLIAQRAQLLKVMAGRISGRRSHG